MRALLLCAFILFESIASSALKPAITNKHKAKPGHQHRSRQKPQNSTSTLGVTPLISRDLKLWPRQEPVCAPGWENCPEDPFVCCPIGDICQISRDSCCPLGSETCDGANCCLPDSTCCNAGEYCCEEGDTCCSGLCCDVEFPECCGEFCCEENGTCCEEGCCDDGDTCCGTETCCLEGYECCASGDNCCLPDQSCCKVGCCNEGDTCLELDTGSFCLPTLEFQCTFGFNEDLCQNMCNGMVKFGNVLTYGGSNDTKRDISCPPGTCNFSTTGLTCDEYPPASTLEGGRTDAVTACVPQAENNNQGTQFSSFYNTRLGFVIGSPFKILLLGFPCGQFTAGAVSKRAAQIPLDHTYVHSPTKWDKDQNLNYAFISLGTLLSGNYQLKISTRKIIEMVEVFDTHGLLYSGQITDGVINISLAMAVHDGVTAQIFTKESTLEDLEYTFL